MSFRGSRLPEFDGCKLYSVDFDRKYITNIVVKDRQNVLASFIPTKIHKNEWMIEDGYKIRKNKVPENKIVKNGYIKALIHHINRYVRGNRKSIQIDLHVDEPYVNAPTLRVPRVHEYLIEYNPDKTLNIHALSDTGYFNDLSYLET